MPTNYNAHAIGVLIAKYIRKELTADESVQLQEWVYRSSENKALFEELTQQMEKKLIDWHAAGDEEDEMWEEIKKRLEKDAGAKVVSLQRGWKYAAAVVLLLAGVMYFAIVRSDKGESVANTENTNKPVHDKAPGKDGAILKLADGREIVLDDAANGLLAQQGKTEVIKKDGALLYTPAAGSGDILYNTLSTPRGRQFQLALPDGSRVWLNAASSITYPTSFASNERVVKVSGEVYMEIAKDASRPFRVAVRGMEVEVVGTVFNVNAYEDEEAIKTTLVEGKVKVKKDQAMMVLKPGQQSVLTTTGLKLKDNADVGQALAWKNGFFQFDNDDLQTVMRQLGRWYDVAVAYEGAVPEISFSGELRMQSKLSEVLALLEKWDVRFRVEGNRVVVLSKRN